MPIQTRTNQRRGIDDHEHARNDPRPVSGKKRAPVQKPKHTSGNVVGVRFSPGNGAVRTINNSTYKPRVSAGKKDKKPDSSRDNSDTNQNPENGVSMHDDELNDLDKNGANKETSELPDASENQPETEVNKEAEEEKAENIPPKSPSPPPAPPEPEKFTIEKFNKTMDSFAERFESSKFTTVTDDYPVDDLVSVVNEVTDTIEEFKEQTVSSQRHLEDLRLRMREVKEKIQRNVEQKTHAIRINDENQSVEERELTERLTRLNAQVAQANAELAEALRLSTETENTAVEAQLAAQRAKDEAKNIQEELAFRAKVEERRKEQERLKQIEERKAMEEELRRQKELEREKEEEWRRKEHGLDKPPVWEAWPSYEYKIRSDLFDVGCIIRGDPNKFHQDDVTCTLLDQLQCPVTIDEGEELISNIIELQGNVEQLQNNIVVCIPFKAPKSNAHAHVSREAIVKVEQNGEWSLLETKEEYIDSYKDFKFAVAETKLLTKMAVFSRLKQDYATVSKNGGKVTSSYDQRISLTIPKNCIEGKEHLLMEVMPVDSTSVNDLKARNPNCRGLLTSSPIIHMKWESSKFEKPVTVTVPCPPNPIKAKKIAAMRKAKEEQMKNPPQRPRVLLPHELEALEKEKAKSKLQKMQEQIADEENKVEEPKQTKWYMGEYAKNEDDENDSLYLVSSHGNNKWSPVENVNIMQVKLDLLQFDLDRPLEKFMVLRTRTNVDEDSVGSLATEVSSFLSQKMVQVILKQRSDDLFDTVMSVVPASRTEKTVKKLAQDGYDDGPDPSQVISINEGDVIEVGFRGNVTSKDQNDIKFVYNSNMQSETEFYACEVDKYLQKNFPVFRGVVEVYRKYKVKAAPRRKRMDSADDQEEEQYEQKRDLMCELTINIPKYHVENNSTVVRAPITIRNTTDPVNESLMRYIAEELGDEWKQVAGHLNVSKARIQAILRNLQYSDQTDADARFDMLMTWLKQTPKAVDKVNCLTTALLKSGRGDIAEDIRERDREFREQQRGQMAQ